MELKIKSRENVHATLDYGQFKKVLGNREVKTKGVKWDRLCESMQKHGQLVPAIVDKDFYILDGQHRLEACRHLGIPFVYVFTNGTTSAEVIGDLNASNSWGVLDYINYYASRPVVNAASYKRLQSLLVDFKELTPSSMIALALLKGDGGAAYTKAITAGRIVFTQQEYDCVREVLSDMKAQGYMSWQRENHITSRPFWLAVGFVYRHPKADPGRLIKVLRENEDKIPSTARVKDLLQRFSTLYNKKLAKENRVYLDVDYEQGRYKKWVEDETA